MPQLSQQENELLKLLGSEKKATLRTRQLRQLSLLLHRMMREADESAQKARAAEIMAQGFYLVVSGKVDENDIYTNANLTESQRDDLLRTLQLRLFAEQFCELEKIPLDGLPVLAYEDEPEPAPTTSPETSATDEQH